MRSIVLRTTLAVVAAFQVVLGIAFIAAPAPFAAALGLPQTPPWAAWMFAMFSARALAFAYGCALAFRDPDPQSVVDNSDDLGPGDRLDCDCAPSSSVGR